MQLGDLIEFLGWVTAISFGIALLNFISKFVHKHYISKLGKDKKVWADYYRKVMKLVIRYHKLAGTVAVTAVLTHFTVAYSNGFLSLTGIVSAVMMSIIFFLGMYGAFVSKNYSGNWLRIHRLVAFALIFSIGIHIIWPIGL